MENTGRNFGAGPIIVLDGNRVFDKLINLDFPVLLGLDFQFVTQFSSHI